LERNASVVDVWRQYLPEGFYEHCSLVGVSGGVLKIEVDPGPYMHEMQVLSSKLLEHLQSCCGQAGIKRIKLRPRKVQQSEASQ